VLDEKEIVIKDACILFDLVDLNLLGVFFQLALNSFTTPQVIGEITNEEQWVKISRYIDDRTLKIDDEGHFETILEIYEKHPGLSIADSSVLELAIRKKAIIFSSDGSLRKISTRNNLIVRGILWIIEELYKKEIISLDTVLNKLDMYTKNLFKLLIFR